MKLGLWLLKKALVPELVERLLLCLALHEALYDVFPSLHKAYRHGMKLLVLQTVLKNGRYVIEIPPSSFYFHQKYKVEVFSDFEKTKKKRILGMRVQVKKMNNVTHGEWVVCAEKTHVLTTLFTGLFTKFVRSYRGTKEALHRIGVMI